MRLRALLFLALAACSGSPSSDVDGGFGRPNTAATRNGVPLSTFSGGTVTGPIVGAGLSFSSTLAGGSSGTDFAMSTTNTRSAGLMWAVVNNSSTMASVDYQGSLTLNGGVTAQTVATLNGGIQTNTSNHGLLISGNKDAANGDGFADVIEATLATRSTGEVWQVYNGVPGGGGTKEFAVGFQGNATATGAVSDSLETSVTRATLQTTDATQSTLASFANPSNTVGIADCRVEARKTDGTVGAAFDIQEGARNAAGTVTIIGSVAAISSFKDAGASTWAATMDVSGNLLRVRVTGAAGVTINWIAQCRYSAGG